MGFIDGGDDGRKAEIVELTRFRGQGVRPVIGQVEAYWETIRGGRLVPTRADVDPRGLRGTLAHVFILERVATGLARFRISGSHLADMMGLEIRGMPISAVFTPDSRDKLADALQAVFDEPAVARFEIEAETGFGRPDLGGDMILLPLRSDLGEVSRALGAIVMAGDIGRTPRRLTIRTQSRRGLTGFGGQDAAPLRGFSELEEADRPGGRTAPAPVRRISARPQSRPPHLRVVSDNTLAY